MGRVENSSGARAAERDVEVVAAGLRLPGRLVVPPGAQGIVVFAHGSGSGRHSPRNTFVASVLNTAGLGTLLLDLLTPDEEADRANVFDIELLADRLTTAPSGCAPSSTRVTSRSAGSARAPARGPHSGRRVRPRLTSPRSSPAVADPIWPVTACRRCRRRRY